jgi:hypothetical protein
MFGLVVTPGDLPPDVPPVTTPDLVDLAKDLSKGIGDGGLIGKFFAMLYASLLEGIKAIISLFIQAFDEVLSLIVPAVTSGQGFDTTAFYDLVAALINDLLGVDVAGADIATAHDERGTIPAMQQVGKDLLNTLLNEFVTGTAGSAAGDGSYGLPGASGSQLTPVQGVNAARAFLGFILSFSVRQGNVATMTDALSFHLLGQIREYGEMMAKNLGLGRLSRRVLQPIIQTTIVSPLTRALNFQYRPHALDAKQLAAAYLRGEITQTRYETELQLQGYADGDIKILREDTTTRLPLIDLLLLHENGIITDGDLNKRVGQLGFSQDDLAIILQARQLAAVQGADRAYAAIITDDLVSGRMTEGDFAAAFAALRIPKLERDAISRNAAHRLQGHRKHLSLGFLKRAYDNASITLDEYIAHAVELGFSQDQVDILEQELLVEQKLAAGKVKAKAAKIAAKAKKTPPVITPPPTP